VGPTGLAEIRDELQEADENAEPKQAEGRDGGDRDEGREESVLDEILAFFACQET